MLKITLTGINFDYGNGYDEDYTGVNLSFSSSGATFSVGGFIKVTNEQFMTAAGNMNALKDIIKQEVISTLSAQ
ncbi:hypothetical protein BIV60_17095 [Bacillus sp. MUM 116]|uniref:hypothetical protein n=1 Tax=Bacillus sp. MUM 116 TaxID=1678002 RepID=UPI0008F5DC98|nr:hypothetical protein [Bacillus sp. MUM 116]OIK11971.1 hypothetical protein BIV60_17095 [Bacillus sp. MUM 116]